MALVLFVRKITIYQGFIRYIKAGNIEISDIKILNLISDCEEKWNIKTRVELYRNALVTSPILIGFFRPSIVLPVGELEETGLFYIFLHELLHYKQRDMFYKWLIQLVICIHWFNPFVYLLEKEVNRACELSCDEAVISILDDKARREYGDMLISFLKSNNFYKSSFASVTLTEGAAQLKERLGAIMNFKKKTKAIRILTSVLTWCIIFGAAFVGVYPVAAATDSNSVGTSESPIPDEKYHRTGTSIDNENSDSDGYYIYGENSDSGWYLGDEAWDNNWNNWNRNDIAFTETYAAFGIEKNGKSIYYQNKLIYVFLDQRSANSYYVDINPKGTESIQIVRNEKDNITGVSYMTEEEVTELVGGRMEIPVINTKEWDSSALLTIEAYYKTDNIFIRPSTTNKVILKEYLTEDKSSYYASTEIKNNVLTIRSGDRPTANYKSYIEIYVPNAILDNLKVETVSGAITADNYTGMLALSTTSGRISISNSNIAGNIHTVSGSIELYPSGVLEDLYVYSNNGKIIAYLPTSISYGLKAETTTGKIKCNHFNIQSENEKEISEIVGSNPKFTITLKTFSANIEINEN